MLRKAFTLIELLVVISIIALLSSVVLASLNSAREKGRIAAGKQAAANVYHAEADQAVAVWDFNEGSGATASDRSGYGNNLTLYNGATWSTDTPTGTGYSLFLDGSNDYASAPDASSLDIGTSDVTMAAWIKTSSNGVSQRIISKRFGALGMGYSLVLDNTGTPYIEILDNSTYIIASAPAAVNDGKWHFIVGVIARSGSGFVCTDGACGTKVNFAPIASDNITNSLAIEVGSVLTGGSGLFNGLIDDARVFTKSLTATEVGKLYAAETARIQAVAAR